jgi:hypothetical protein
MQFVRDPVYGKIPVPTAAEIVQISTALGVNTVVYKPYLDVFAKVPSLLYRKGREEYVSINLITLVARLSKQAVADKISTELPPAVKDRLSAGRSA